MLESTHLNSNKFHYLLLKKLTLKQQLNIKGSIVNFNNRLNSVLSSFNPFSSEFSLGYRLIDIFPNHFSFYSANRNCKERRKAYIHKLDKVIFQTSADSKTAVIITDASIKNQVATLISHIHVHNNSIIKTLHYVVNITFTKAKLFTIRYSIN